MPGLNALPVIRYTPPHEDASKRMAQKSDRILCVVGSLYPVHIHLCHVLAQHNQF